MHLIQIFLVLFALFAVTRVVPRLRSRVVRPLEGAMWLLVWTAVAAVALLPQVAQWLADAVGVGRGADAVIYVALTTLVYALFRLHLAMRRLQSEVTELVRRLAIERANREF